MSKIDYRKIQNLIREILAELVESPETTTSAQPDYGKFGFLVKEIQKELRDIRLSLISIKVVKEDHESVKNPDPPAQCQTAVKDSSDAAVPHSEKLQTNENAEIKSSGSSKEIARTASIQSALSSPAGVPEKLKEKKTVQKLSTGGAPLPESFFQKPTVRAFILCIILPVSFLAGYAMFIDSQPDADPLKAAKIDTSIPFRKVINSDFPVSPGKQKAAEEAFNKGKAEMEKKNFLTAAEHFRLALSADPSNEKYLAAFKEATTTSRTNKQK